jgi:pimeloyl-ACP methyl ester carboxylesterase
VRVPRTEQGIQADCLGTLVLFPDSRRQDVYSRHHRRRKTIARSLKRSRVTVSGTAKLTYGNRVSAAGGVAITVLPPLLGCSWIDCLDHLSALLGDRVFYGCGARKGDGEPVLLIPGFFAGDWTMSTMARWFARLGYRPYLSGIDWNVGCPDRKVAWLGRRIGQITRGGGRPVVLIGHSLGGLLARSAAVECPERVRHVVMLGGHEIST